MESKTPSPTPAPAPNPQAAPAPAAAPAKAPAAAPAPAPKAAAQPAPAAKPQAPAPQKAGAAKAPVFELPPAVYSPSLLESVRYDIQYYLDWVHQNQIRTKVGAKPKDEPSHSAETVLVINAWQAGRPTTIESLEALQDHLRTLKLPEVHIMLAALPNRAQREVLVSWFRTNVSPHLLLSFVADRNLGGGLVVRTPNRVFDYTWKAQLVAGRAKLAEILKRV